MADITLSYVPYPIGTTVGVYQRKSEQMLPDMPPTQIPQLTTGQVAADKSLAFTGLSNGSYWAIAPIGSTYQYVAFHIQAP